MRWEEGRRSTNVEDRRGIRGRPAFVGGGLGTIVLILVALYFGVDPSALLQGIPGGTGQEVGQPQADPSSSPGDTGASGAPDPAADFVSAVLATTEDTWSAIFADRGRQYQAPVLVLFSGSVRSACGMAQAAMGPFYCPADHKAYIDLSFYQDLRDRFQAPGDFAQAYVIAHEIGHHVQNLLGISDKVAEARQQMGETEANALSVRVELQADCFAGIWANRNSRILEAGDVEEALTAASAIGDDRLQQQSRGYVTPDSFTHGSAAQRVRWFRKGLDGGKLGDCDTFGADQL